MAVIHDEEEYRRDWAEALSTPPRRCALCHGLLTYPLIFWQGDNATIFLHTDCVLPFCKSLAQDIERYDGGTSRDWPRVLRELKKAQEGEQ